MKISVKIFPPEHPAYKEKSLAKIIGEVTIDNHRFLFSYQEKFPNFMEVEERDYGIIRILQGLENRGTGKREKVFSSLARPIDHGALLHKIITKAVELSGEVLSGWVALQWENDQKANSKKGRN